jgi:hypothetical protein
MNHRITAGAAILAALAAGAGIGHARMPADLATAAPTLRPCTTEDDPGPCHWDAQHQGNGKGTSFDAYPPRAVPSEVPSRAEAERYYVTHLGPSAAWRAASPTERDHAVTEYRVMWDGDEGCLADLRHAYQGTVAEPELVQPSLPVTRLDDSDIVLGEYADGVCGE